VRFPTVIEQFEMRKLVAPVCAELARLNAADPDIAELHHLSKRLSERAAAGKTTFEAEGAFNLTLAEISQNPLLVAHTRQLWHLMASHTWRIIRGAEGPAEWAEIAGHYAAISAAVAHGDASAAGAAMRRHLRHLDRRYFRGRAVDDGAAA
jgi:GntR family transcriptional repressor for pyruvate dehydrogenase complex